MMPAHQIWSCHLVQDANFKNFLFCSNSSFNIKKSHKISSGKALYFRSYQPKTSRGVESPPPPVPLGLSEQEGRKLDLKEFNISSRVTFAKATSTCDWIHFKVIRNIEG